MVGFTTQVGRDHSIDGVLKGPHGRRVAIEARIDGGRVAAVWIEIVRQSLLGQSDEPGSFAAVLLITRTPLTSEAQELVSKSPEIHHVVFHGPEHKADLKRAASEVLLG